MICLFLSFISKKIVRIIMKKIIAFTLLICILTVLLMPLSLADQAPAIKCDTLRLPALGEKLETPKEVFTFEGFTFSLYGLEKTDEAILIHAHIKNGTSHTLECSIDKTFFEKGGRIDREISDIPWSERPAPGAETDVTYSLKYLSGSIGVSDTMSTFTFTVLPYAGSLPMCSGEVIVLLGEAPPCELEFTDPSDPFFYLKRDSRAVLFSADGILIHLLYGCAFDTLEMNISHSGHDKPIKVAFENLVVNGESVEDVYDFLLDPESQKATISLPFADVKTMTCNFAVYDAETRAQIFEKTRVILGEAPGE